MCGTLPYMAPEICKKIPYHGPPADMWAIGVVFYVLIFGRFPFNGKTDRDIFEAITRGFVYFPRKCLTSLYLDSPLEPESPTKSEDDGIYYSCESRGIISDLLRKDPKKRLSAQ